MTYFKRFYAFTVSQCHDFVSQENRLQDQFWAIIFVTFWSIFIPFTTDLILFKNLFLLQFVPNSRQKYSRSFTMFSFKSHSTFNDCCAATLVYPKFSHKQLRKLRPDYNKKIMHPKRLDLFHCVKFQCPKCSSLSESKKKGLTWKTTPT